MFRIDFLADFPEYISALAPAVLDPKVCFWAYFFRGTIDGASVYPREVVKEASGTTPRGIFATRI